MPKYARILTMKYGETIFDIIYLLFVFTFAIILFGKRRKTPIAMLFGAMALFLGIGDAFHLIPRIISYWSTDDLYIQKGLGKMLTSLTMTVFYLILEMVRKIIKQERSNAYLVILVILGMVRMIICVFPQNGWFYETSSAYTFSIIRNIPFALMGGLTVYLWFKDFRSDKYFKYIWVLVALSFTFYFITVFGAPFVNWLGMMMIPKTICYMVMIVLFYLFCKNEKVIY